MALVLNFVRGAYILNKNITVSGIRKISLLKNESSLIPSDSIIITCTNTSRFTVSNVYQVHLHGLKFQGCGGSEFVSIAVLTIAHMVFMGTQNSESLLTITRSNTTISMSTFHSNELMKENYHQFLPYLEDILSLNYPKTFSVSVGGALIATHSRLDISDSHFVGNKANIGGAVFVLESNVRINGSVFVDNSAKAHKNNFGLGGVLFSIGTGHVIILNSTFENNTSVQSGGVIAHVFSAQFTSVSLGTTYNMSHDEGCCLSDVTDPILEHCSTVIFVSNTVVNNKAGTDGGAMFIYGSNATISISNCDFLNNTAERMGGVIATTSSNVILNGSKLASNSAMTGGGVVSIQKNSTINIDGCIFFGNTVVQGKGGVIYAECVSSIDNQNCTNFANDSGAYSSMEIVKCKCVNIVMSHLRKNTALYGGVLFAEYANIGVFNSKFDNNTARSDGGCIFLNERSVISVEESIFLHNVAQHEEE